MNGKFFGEFCICNVRALSLFIDSEMQPKRAKQNNRMDQKSKWKCFTENISNGVVFFCGVSVQSNIYNWVSCRKCDFIWVSIYFFCLNRVQIKVCWEHRLAKQKIVSYLHLSCSLFRRNRVTAAAATRQIKLSFVWNEFIFGHEYPNRTMQSEIRSSKVVVRLPQIRY